MAYSFCSRYEAIGSTRPLTQMRKIKGKGKVIPVQAWTGPDGSRRLKLPISRQSTHEGGKVVSRMHRPPLPPGNIPGTHFC
jgi:hypothetical protein